MVVPRETHLDGKPSGPPNLRTLTWRDLINSCWKDTNYKRVAMASLVHAVYLLELDRQENRTQENALAPSWWIPFKYKLTKILIDERDGSIFGAIFEWDRSAALADLLPIRPSGAPKAVLALRGTLLKSPTRRRDIEDDIRFALWESLKGSFRFEVTLKALQSVFDTHGRRNVCIAGHSLGAGFGLQVGKELAKEGINVESHLFNPPSVSLAMSIGYIGEKVEHVWNGLKSMLFSGSEAQVSNDGDMTYSIRLKRLKHRFLGMMDAGFGVGNRVPHLYINSNDYISCLYFYTDITDKENVGPNAANLFVVSKENQQFLEAHSLKQWWSSDAELEQDIHNSKLISRQLSHINIIETTGFVWNILKSMPLSVGRAQVCNDGNNTSSVGLKGWIPSLSVLKGASCWVGKCVSYLYVYKNDGSGENMVDKVNKDPTNRKMLFLVSKEKQKFLATHGLKQWWPSEAELVQVIHNRKHISGKLRYLYSNTSWEVTHLLNPPSISLVMSLSNLGEREEFVWKWNSLKSMLPSSSETQVSISNERNNASDVGLKSWIPQLSSLKNAGLAVGKWVPNMYSNNSDYISRQLRSLYSCTPSQVSHLFNLTSVLPAMSPKDTEEKAELVCKNQVSNGKNSETGLKSWIPQLSGLKDAGYGVGKWISQLYAHKSNGPAEKMDDVENIGPSEVAQGKPS
uniref:GDSL esterase/lipase At4g10955 family n=1 Tax=Cajanus cajan TaxID=3821 RepID=A0A151U280_CAJCA|nr:GDSL esterase/lipase At4g10955 family [Cajanus cajan]